jgi:hypothetical protein
MNNHIKKSKKINEWTILRVIASSRIILFLFSVIILLTLGFKLPDKNKLGFLITAFILFVYLWINIIVVMVRAFDSSFKGGIKLRKILFLFIVSILTYSFIYYAIDNYFTDSFYESIEYKKDKNLKEHPILKFFDMMFFTINIMTTLGYNVDITPRNRIIKTVVASQCISSILLLIVLFSRVI